MESKKKKRNKEHIIAFLACTRNYCDVVSCSWLVGSFYSLMKDRVVVKSWVEFVQTGDGEREVGNAEVDVGHRRR